MGSLEVRYLEVERQLWIRDSRRVCEQLKLQYCHGGERYIGYVGRYESDRKQGQTNSWGVDIVIDHDMPYLQYSNSSSASKERMEAAALQS